MKLSSLQHARLENLINAAQLRPEYTTCYGKVISVYDGDTIKVKMLTSPNESIIKSIRLYGIDAPEIKPPKDKPNRDEEIKQAKQVRDWLAQRILDKIVLVVPTDIQPAGNYGRLLANVYLINKENNNSDNGGYGGGDYGGGDQIFTQIPIQVLSDQSISNELLQLGMVKSYFGGKRE